MLALKVLLELNKLPKHNSKDKQQKLKLKPLHHHIKHKVKI